MLNTQNPSGDGARSAGKSTEKPVSPAKALITTLVRMENQDAGSDRATMAALRCGLRHPNGIAIEMMPFLSKFLPHTERPSDARYFQIAALFALHPENTYDSRNGSFASAFRLLADKGSDSIEKRFQMLLACRDEDVFRHLQQCIGLLKSENIPLNWTRLLEDLVHNDWDDPERPLQLRWAREFYRHVHYTPSTAKDAA